MIIYNVTIKVEHSIAEKWLTWLKEEHIPDIIATGCFIQTTILHLLEADDTEGITYAVQYHAVNKLLYDQYIEKFSDKMRKKGAEKWGNQFVAFRSVMEVVH